MHRTPAFVVGIVLLATASFAQMEKSKPAPELKKLDYFAGNWTSEGDVKQSPMGPGGKVTMDERSEWMEGEYFLVIRSKWTSAAMGNGSGVAFMGYDTNDKVYTYDEFNSGGEATHAKGVVDGDTWRWTNDMKMGPQIMKGRYTVKIVSPTLYTYKYEVSPDGTNWNTVVEGKDTKSK
jgi:Protein of unknown function (DUF1579)